MEEKKNVPLKRNSGPRKPAGRWCLGWGKEISVAGLWQGQDRSGVPDPRVGKVGNREGGVKTTITNRERRTPIYNITVMLAVVLIRNTKSGSFGQHLRSAENH